MIVPRYWAEGRLQERKDKRQVTVRRWGWSDEGQEQAQAHAESRARDALQRILDGEPLKRRERRVAYNGADGVPIREEIVSSHGDTVITRNGYGALCLNTPDVLFADVDFGATGLACSTLAYFAVASAAAATLFATRNRFMVGIAAALASLVLVTLAWKLIQRLKTGAAGGAEAEARSRVAKFARSHPDWRIRIYRTPAGLRVLVLHRLFDPNSRETAEFFHALRSDPIYIRMCVKQHCFRARVSPKPWRVGIGDHVKPRPGIWPLPPEKLARRQQWVAAYEAASRGYASCRYLETLGNGPEDPAAVKVRVLHDELSGALGSLPLA